MRTDSPWIRIGGPVLGVLLLLIAVMAVTNRVQRAREEAAGTGAETTAAVEEAAPPETTPEEPASQEAATPEEAESPTPEEPPPAEPAPVSQEAMAPPQVVSAFNKGGCAGCHVIPGVPGATGRIGPDLSTIGVDAATRVQGMDAEAYIRQSILDPNAFIAPDCWGRECPAGVMLQTFAETLSPEDLDTIVGYLLTLGTGQEPFVEAAEPERQGILVALPPESVLEPFMPLPKDPPSEAKITLGKYLFFDKRLSGSVALSCASCHQPDKAFTDGQELSRGFPSTQYFRNTPTVYNTAFMDYLYWDGRMDGGDMATLVRDHLTEAHFMSMDGRLMVERIRQVPEYMGLFQEAFGGEPSFGKVLNAIAAYVQTLNSRPVAYDQALAGDTSGFSDEELAGYQLFTGKAGCSECHSGPLLTDNKFYNTGVGTRPDLLEDPERHLTFRRFFRTLGVPGYRGLREDVGRYALTMDEADWGKFRTPSLREVARTAPYMHDGSLATLEDVVRFYNQGGGPGQTAGLEPLGLTDQEVGQLVAFLESLSSDLPPVEPPVLPDYGLVPPGTEPPAIPPIVEGQAAAAGEQPPAPQETPEEAAPQETPASEAGDAAPADSPEDTTALAIEAMVKSGCGGCHIIPQVPGAAGQVGPDLSEIGAQAGTRVEGMDAAEYLYQAIVDPNAFVAPECPLGPCPPNVMPANFADILSEEEIQAIVDFLVTLGSGR